MDRDPTVLVVCADERRLDELVGELCADGHAAEGAKTGRQAQVKAYNRPAQAVIVGGLERALEGLELVRGIRAGTTTIDADSALMMVGRSGGERELVRCLEAGADDYLAPGAGYRELRARLEALQRRLERRRGGGIRRIGALEFDPHERRVRYDGAEVSLTRLQFDLLERLAREPGALVTKAELLQEVWGYALAARTRTVDAHACRLRQSLSAAGADGLVVCVRGVGYRLRVPSTSAPSKPQTQTPQLRAA